MTKLCDNCGIVEVPEDRDVCEACIEKVMKQSKEQKEEVKEKSHKPIDDGCGNAFKYAYTPDYKGEIKNEKM